MQEQEIFQHYELKNWELSPRLYKILGVSTIANIFLFGLMAQANFLTAKSCDTPFVSGVCKVLDTLYVGSMLMDTETGFVNEAYVKTELEDAEITWIDMSGQMPPLEYPAGYFAVANPESVTNDAMIIPNDFGTNPTLNSTTNPTIGTYIPGITGNTNPTYNKKSNNKSTDLSTKAQVTPTPNKDAIPKDLPTEFPTDNPTTTTTSKANKQNKKNPTKENPTTEQTEQQKVDSKSVNEVSEINRKPFEDLGDSLNEKIAKNEVDLNKPFLVMMDGTLTADGKLDKKTSKYVRSEGDPQMVLVAKDAIEAIGDSGFLSYLKNNGIDKANLTLKQDDTQIYVQLISDQKDANKANSTASGFNTMLQGLILLDKNGIKKLDDNSKLLVNNAKVTSDGRNFVLTVIIPKTDAQAMINKSLKDRAEKKSKQVNSNIEANKDTNAQTTK